MADLRSANDTAEDEPRIGEPVVSDSPAGSDRTDAAETTSTGTTAGTTSTGTTPAATTADTTTSATTADGRPTVDSTGVHSTHAEREARADHELTGDDVPEGDGIPSAEVMQDTTSGGGADRAEMVGIETGGEMDYPEHEETYSLFLGITKWGVIIVVVLLIALAIWFYGGGGPIGGVVAFFVLLVAARILF